MDGFESKIGKLWFVGLNNHADEKVTFACLVQVTLTQFLGISLSVRLLHMLLDHSASHSRPQPMLIDSRRAALNLSSDSYDSGSTSSNWWGEDLGASPAARVESILMVICLWKR